ncbi:MAG: FAD-dependent oxidoreductase [Wenzhouxiangellaceae bacterium]
MASIAIVGSGIAGLYSGWRLAKNHQVTLYESQDRLGGHTDTHIFTTCTGKVAVDSGFIVFNQAHYPLFSKMLDDLGVASQPSVMSFSMLDERTGMEYCASPSPSTLFARRANWISPAFFRMLGDIRRFYIEARQCRTTLDDRLTLGEFLDQRAYSREFAEWHLLPMAGALWSASNHQVRDYPMRYLLAFMHNHCMLQFRGRPTWRTVQGGSQRYIDALREATPIAFRIGDGVRRISRDHDGVAIVSDGHEARYDAVIIACHSDQALALLADPSAAEKDVLGAIEYAENHVQVHCDEQVMPRRRQAWGGWNALQEHTPNPRCAVSYHMNQLQSLPTDQDFIVSLNLSHRIRSDRVMAERYYHHPQYTPQTVAAQQRWSEISGLRRTWYAGAYWGWGFHEDGARSAERAVRGVSDALAA